MSASEFSQLCRSLGIDPGIALENDAVRAALKARDSDEVRRLLREEF